MRCAVYGCSSDNQSKNFKNNIKFFRFPLKNGLLTEAWKHACSRRDNFNIVTARICALHFEEDQFYRDLRQELLNNCTKSRRLLKEDAVPCLNLPRKTKKCDDKNDLRKNRLLRRNRNKLVESVMQSHACGDGAGNTLDVDSENDELNNIPLINNAEQACVSHWKDVGVNTETNEVENLNKVINNLKAKISVLEKQTSALQKLFTETQIKKLTKNHRLTRWTAEDISRAIVIYSAGPRAYRLLLKKGYPYPAVSTLRSWCKKIQIAPGILKQVFNVIKRSDMTEFDRVAILSFDEMKIRKVYLYDKANDETLKPYAYVQVAMLRGLFSNWKQPIFFNYDTNMKKDILLQTIEFAESVGFYIVGIVSDLGPSNRGLHSELGVTMNEPWFQNPTNNHRIYVFADVPHLIKLIRNNFIDYGFIINGKEINKSIIEKVLEFTRVSDVNITFKISEHHLDVQGAERQKVKLATKLFSHTVSRAISRCGMLGYFENNVNWLECSEFFKDVNDWFDCLNTRVPQADSRNRMKAYGLDLSVQSTIIEKMTALMSNMRVKGKNSLLPFQKGEQMKKLSLVITSLRFLGVIMTNNALKLLFEDVNKRFQAKFVLTYHLNQDVLENFFGVIRAKGGMHDVPDALEFKYRLRQYILGRNEGSLSTFGNVEPDETPDLLQNFNEKALSGQYFSKLVSEENNTVTEYDGLEEEINSLKYDGLEHLAGYITHKIGNSENKAENKSFSFTWVDHLSEGGLKKPSDEMMNHVKQLENIFNNVNSDSLSISRNYLKHLLLLATDIPCNDKIKRLFFRSRMYFRIKSLNRDLIDKTRNRKRKMKRIIK